MIQSTVTFIWKKIADQSESDDASTTAAFFGTGPGSLLAEATFFTNSYMALFC